MEKPFEFIECKLDWRKEFKVTDGHQPTYAFFFLKEGSFQLKMDGIETVVKENDCVIFSDDINFFRSVISPISFLYLQFRVNPKCPFHIHIPIGIVNFCNHSRFLDSVQKYEALMDTDDARAIYYREHLLEDILLQAFAESDHFAELGSPSANYGLINCHDTVVLQAVEYIMKNIRYKLRIEDICRDVGTNPSTLNFKFHKELSCSVWDYIIEARMKSARHYLTSTTYTIAEIAGRCGFDNIYYFSTAFRKYHGTSPTDFRNRYR